MNKVRLTKQFDFEAAHALDGYHGKCKDIHGHSYHLNVTIIGEPCSDPKETTLGMVMDFADLKVIVKDNIINRFDHWLILKNDSRFIGLDKHNERIRYVDYQPTCENMLLEIVAILLKKLPPSIKLHNVFLRETARSYAEWFAADQL